MMDNDGNISYWNEAAERIFGYSAEEALGKGLHRLLSPQHYYEPHMKAFRTFKTTGNGNAIGKTVELEAIRRDGTKFPIELSLSAVKIEDKWHSTGIVRDITQRKEAADALQRANNELEQRVEERTSELLKSNEQLKREMEERMKAEESLLFKTTLLEAQSETTIDGILVVDVNSKAILFNSRFGQMWRIPQEILDTRNDDKLLHYVSKQLEDPDKFLKKTRYLYDHREEKSEDELEFRDGRVFERYSCPLVDSTGKFHGRIWYFRDVTERKRAEALERASIVAEAANRSKSEFLANMSHEIRTPLNGIIGMAELAMDTAVDNNQMNLFNIINREAETLLNLISDILDFSKIEAGKLKLEEIPFDLRVMIEDVGSSLGITAEQKGLEFISFLSPDVPARLIGDPTRLRQVLMNLAGNSIKFTHKGEIYIKGEMLEDLGDEIKIRVLVKDTGIGIPKDQQSRIFESFTQGDGSTTRKYGGTGLGTSICKQLIEMMRGEIGLASEEGKGSTFWFTAVLAKQTGKTIILAKKEVDLTGLRVLVVDDNKTNRFILMEHLNSWGCCPAEATDGLEALSILNESVSAKKLFDLILTDFQMPGMSGFTLAKEVKAGVFKGVPIIVITSAGKVGDGKICRDLGIEGYLTKPTRRDDLRKAIESILERSCPEEDHTAPQLVTRHTITEEYRQNIRILIVEDYPTNQQVAIRHLRGGGYQVDLAENGQQAVEAYKRKHYDLILMDIQMPVMDGYEATGTIRNLEAGLKEGNETKQSAKIPIIAMTAHALKGDREKCLTAGMDDYISKPLKRKQLLDIVDKWVIPPSESRKEPEQDQSKVVPIKKDNPIDFEKALDEFEGDEEFLMELLLTFLENVRTQIKAIRQAISDGDADLVRREAHSIKGGAANLTADDLCSVANELEKIGKSSTLEGSIEVLGQLEKEFCRLEIYASDR